MKKTIWICTGLLLLSLGTLRAQQDTLTNKNKTRTQPNQPTVIQPTPVVPQPQSTTPARDANTNTYRQQDQILIHQDQVPPPLKQTLQGTQYNGWENSTMYQDRHTGEYFLELKTGANTPKTYRFDKNGRLIQDPNKPGNSQDQQNN